MRNATVNTTVFLYEDNDTVPLCKCDANTLRIGSTTYYTNVVQLVTIHATIGDFLERVNEAKSKRVEPLDNHPVIDINELCEVVLHDLEESA